LREKHMPRLAAATAEPQRRAARRVIRNIWMRIHRTFSLSFSALTFALLGVSLGILAHRSHMLSGFFLGCLPVMLVYYPVFILGQSMADQEMIPVAAGCWTPVGVLGAIGVGLLCWLFVR
ncbi:unnamed protein product, partial [marine sediment metagenome]